MDDSYRERRIGEIIDALMPMARNEIDQIVLLSVRKGLGTPGIEAQRSSNPLIAELVTLCMNRRPVVVVCSNGNDLELRV